MKTLFELATLKMSRMDAAKYVSLFDSESNPVEEVLEFRRKSDRDAINKEFKSSQTRKKWWMHISFFDEEDENPRWVRFVRGKMLNILTGSVGKIGKRKRTIRSKAIVSYYDFKIKNDEMLFVDQFFDRLHVSLYEGRLYGHIRHLSQPHQDFLFQ